MDPTPASGVLVLAGEKTIEESRIPDPAAVPSFQQKLTVFQERARVFKKVQILRNHVFFLSKSENL